MIVNSTKREILKFTAAVYDPLGWFSPVVLPAKLLIKTIPEELQSQWLKIKAELIKIQDVTIPHLIDIDMNPVESELHCFVDASALAYAAVIYLRNNNQTYQVFAKTGVAPKKAITIPKLELLAALIGTQALKFVKKALENIKISKM